MLWCGVKQVGVLQGMVSQCPFHSANGDGFIKVVAVALLLAIMRAYPSGDGCQRVGPQQDFGGFVYIAFAEFSM